MTAAPLTPRLFALTLMLATGSVAQAGLAEAQATAIWPGSPNDPAQAGDLSGALGPATPPAAAHADLAKARALVGWPAGAGATGASVSALPVDLIPAGHAAARGAEVAPPAWPRLAQTTPADPAPVEAPDGTTDTAPSQGPSDGAAPPTAAPQTPGMGGMLGMMGMGVTAERQLAPDQVPTIAGADVGAYLAAGYAASMSDFAAAARYFDRALTADPGSDTMQESALLAQIALGQIDAALARMKAMPDQGSRHMIGRILGVAEAAKAGDYAAVMARLDAGKPAVTTPAPLLPPPAEAAPVAPPAAEGTTPPAPPPAVAEAPALAPTDPGEGVDLIADLVRGWALVGQGNMSEAVKRFDKVIAVPGAAPFGKYHKALALASVGDFEGADKLLASDAKTEVPLTRRGILAHAQILSQLERGADATQILSDLVKTDPDPILAAARDRLAAGEVLAIDIVANATDGIAEVYFNFAAAMLGGAMPDASTLVYARIAAWLSPAHQDAQLLSAGLLEQMEQNDLAITAYEAVPEGTIFRAIADLGRANALARAGRLDGAVAAITRVTEAQPAMIPAWLALGDMLRRQDKFAEAIPPYDKAVALADAQLGGAEWFTYYARGVAHERSKDWARAEADLRKALSLSPDQPEVLNYLGYSFVDRNENLDEALKLIQAAVAARPDDGYIQDSLGWAYFRLGQYDKAVAPMELAVATMSNDPLVNDHLGDVYWAVGRQREARVQWQRALSLAPDAPTASEVSPDRIRRKIEVGLDQVLAEEGAKPLHGN